MYTIGIPMTNSALALLTATLCSVHVQETIHETTLLSTSASLSHVFELYSLQTALVLNGADDC